MTPVRTVPLFWLALLVSAGAGAQVPVGTPNPYYDIEPKKMFPSKQSLLPPGSTYTDTVPDTLDLAEMAGLFIHGATHTITPDLYYAPANAPLYSDPSFNTTLGVPEICNDNPPPCFTTTTNSGEPNWGNSMHALALARNMSAYDRDDSQGTLSIQYQMMENMLDYGVSYNFVSQGIAPIVAFISKAITPSTQAMEALLPYWGQGRDKALTTGIQEFVRMHSNFLSSGSASNGNTYSYFDIDENPFFESSIGYIGNFYAPYIQGEALRVLQLWYQLSGDESAHAMSTKLANFIRNFPGIWNDPGSSDPQRFPPGPGHFAGHIYSWMLAVYGLLEEAQTLLQHDPNDPTAKANIELANDAYNFVKEQTKPGLVGNIGEIGTLAYMIRVGILLSELGAGNYYEEIEAWTRNTLSENQIDAAKASHIANVPGPSYDYADIGSKVIGMFFSDATHILAIPDNQNFYIGIDGPSNAMRAIYDVWDHTVDIDGSTARINFLLNRASEYLDVKSDLPYRGRVQIDTKSDLGPLKTLTVRIPSWTDKALVRAFGGRNFAGATWNKDNTYVIIGNIKPNASYVLTFPIKVREQLIYQLRASDQMWYEGDYPPSWQPEEDSSYTATFRGDTLVDATPRPTGGVPLYQRQELAALAPGDAAPPTISVTRFVMGAR